MAVEVLADTGGLLALLRENDSWHRRCMEAFRALPLPMLTSEAVLTELFHLAGDSEHHTDVTWNLVRSGALVLAPITDSELPAIQTLMKRYADRPMDFADATLVYLAERESLSTVFTVDHADFATYRIGGRRRFRMIPEPSGTR